MKQKYTVDVRVLVKEEQSVSVDVGKARSTAQVNLYWAAVVLELRAGTLLKRRLTFFSVSMYFKKTMNVCVCYWYVNVENQKTKYFLLFYLHIPSGFII